MVGDVVPPFVIITIALPIFNVTYVGLSFGVRGGLVSVLDCQSRRSGFKSRRGQKFDSRFLLHQRPLANSATMNTFVVHCQWEGETVGKRTGHPHSNALAKKMKSPTIIHTRG